MCTKLPLDENCLLEHYELCPHRLRVRVVTTYNKREPPVRLQDITHLERLGDKPILHRTKYCIWSDMDSSKTELNTFKTKLKFKMPLQKMQERKPAKAENVRNKESLIWLYKPTKPLYQSKTNIYEFTKENLCCDLQDHGKATNVSCPANGTKSDTINFKLKRTLSKTLIDTDKSKKSPFWQNAKINKLLTKSPTPQIGKGTNFTEIIGERHAGGADKVMNKPHIKFFPAYSTSSISQLSVNDKPKVKKALSKRVRSTANKKVTNKSTNNNYTIKSKILGQHQKMTSVMSCQANSSPFLTSCPVSYHHNTVIFNLNTTAKSSQKKDLRSNTLKWTYNSKIV